MVTGISRVDFWSWNFQNGRRNHGNSKNVQNFKMLQTSLNFTKMIIWMCRCTLWLWNLLVCCRSPGNGGRVPSAIACNGKSSYYSSSTLFVHTVSRNCMDQCWWNYTIMWTSIWSCAPDFGMVKMAAVSMETAKIRKYSKCSKLEETPQEW